MPNSGGIHSIRAVWDPCWYRRHNARCAAEALVGSEAFTKKHLSLPVLILGQLQRETSLYFFYTFHSGLGVNDLTGPLESGR